MKKIIFLILFLPCVAYSQDPSFSQFDLNMMNTNPAFASYEGGVRVLLHSRNQWNRINENFNNTLLEVSSRVSLSKNSRKVRSAWCFGFTYMSEDLELFPELGNAIFLKKKELTVIPFTYELKISENSYLTSSPFNFTLRKYDLNWDLMLFSDMIDDFGVYSPTSISPNLFVNNEWIGDLSFGFIYTRHGKYKATQNNRFNFGIAAHHVLNPIESFSENEISDSEIPTKLTYHSEYYGAIPLSFSTRPFIPYYRVLIKHEQYLKDWKDNIMSKTEFGGTMFINNTPIELGSVFRINRIEKDQSLNFQTWVPIMRYRFNSGQHLYIFSYSYDYNVSSSTNSIQYSDAGTTHEVGFSIYLFSGSNKNKDCAAFKQMDQNALYQDIMQNGLLK